MKYSDPQADLRTQFPNAFRKSIVISLLAILLLSLTCVEVMVKPIDMPEYQTTIKVEDIPITKRKVEQKKQPQRRAAPIMAEEEEVPDTVTIEETDLAPVDSYVPPEIEAPEIVEFYALEKPPQVASKVDPEYPDFARRSETEGAVMVEIIIDTDGSVESARVIQARPKGFFEEAAIKAAKQWKFTPAEQRGKPVKVRYQIPIEFKLN
ncbi:energy transducer TonB [bacterium]|nr:energy transducer TonB [bacterium]